MAFLQRFPVRFSLVLTALLLPLQPFVLVAKDTKSADSKEALLAQIMKHVQGPSKHSLAGLALGKDPYFDRKDSIIARNEYKELQIAELAQKLDKSETAFGSRILEQSLLQPVAHLDTILQRQAWAKAVYEDTKLYNDIKRSLKRIKKSEHAILAYWDATQRENGAKLFARAESFYYALLQQLFGEKINDNKWALEASMIQKMGITTFNLLFYIGLQGVATGLFKWFCAGGDFDPVEEFVDGLKMPLNFINPFPTKISKNYDARTVHSFTSALQHGSMGDVYNALTTSYDDNSSIKFRSVGRGIRKVAEVTDCCPSSKWLLERFNEDGDFEVKTEKTVDENGKPIESGFKWYKTRGIGLVGTLAVTYYRGVMLYEAGKTTVLQAKNIINTMKELHVHMMHVARVINTAKDLEKQLSNHPVLKSSHMVERIHQTIANASAEQKKLFELLANDTFLTTKAKTQIFSRGNVLLAHRLMSRTRDQIVPLLQGIGELDALCAMVTNMKEMSAKTPFSFAEFVPGAQAMVDIEDGWLPLVRNAVPNTIAFGGEKPNKVIITGPNGGGKSVFLKVLGAITIMAQSWGIVPAKRVRMTIFDGLRSCIHPEESLEHELSTFMAEKLRIDEIKGFVFSNHHNPHFKVMLLLDEPFRGTVDAESADRIYEFGKDIASLQQSIVLIATHVEKPVRLAQDTNGAFTNYHVCIKELPNGRFDREFKLESGILEWWFNDAQKRSRFIDFITIEKYKEQVAQIKASQVPVAA